MKKKKVSNGWCSSPLERAKEKERKRKLHRLTDWERLDVRLTRKRKSVTDEQE